jgi:site-specific DNA-cytosine methylase
MGESERPPGRSMKVASLFSGCGALDLGLQQAGHDIILQAECDEAARTVLQARFPGVHMVRDVAELECLPVETEVVAASFPCIDVSHAGSRAGVDGAATGLVRHVFRLIAHPRSPRVQWLLLENVTGLLDRHHVDGSPPREPAIAYVVAELERLGYSWAHRVINCTAFGIPQRRRRVFLVASKHGDPRDVLLSCDFQCLGGCRQVFPGPCACCALTIDAHLPRGEASHQMWADQHSPGICIDLSNAQGSPAVGLTPTFTQSNCRMGVLLGDGQFGLLRIQDAERLQGLPEGWTEPAAVVCASHSVSRSREGAEHRFETAVRWMLLGNAVCVPVARWVGTQLARPYQHKYTGHASEQFKSAVPTIWPRCAWALHGERRHGAVSVGEYPCYTRFTPLAQFIGGLGPPPSAEALAMWVKRMHTAGWNLHGPLHGLVQRLSTEVQRSMELQQVAGGPGGKERCAIAFMTWRESLQPEQLAAHAYVREPSKRALVWVKQGTFPHWPALVVDASAGDHIPEKLATDRLASLADAVLVIYLGDASCYWLRRAHTTDWHQGYEAHKDGGARGNRAQRLMFEKAMREAHILAAGPAPLLLGGPAAVDTPQAPDPEPRATPGDVAAPCVAQEPTAAQVCPEPRATPGNVEASCLAPERQTRGPGESLCKGRCKCCVKPIAGGPRCIMEGVTRLAAAGHLGASITASGVRDSGRLKGKRIGVFWPLDARHYFARLVDFDFLTCMWHIHYDDDKTEALALWKERIMFDPAEAVVPAATDACGRDDEDAATGMLNLAQDAAGSKRLCIRK